MTTIGQVSGVWVIGRESTTKPGSLISIMVNNISNTSRLIVENNGKVVQASNSNTPGVRLRFSDPV